MMLISMWRGCSASDSSASAIGSGAAFLIDGRVRRGVRFLQHFGFAVRREETSHEIRSSQASS
ncbi:MAG: hypothetical protein ACLRMJ_08100 [Alistipes finegoldii]